MYVHVEHKMLQNSLWYLKLVFKQYHITSLVCVNIQFKLHITKTIFILLKWSIPQNQVYLDISNAKELTHSEHLPLKPRVTELLNYLIRWYETPS